MMTPSMVTREVGRNVDRDRIARAEAARRARPRNDDVARARNIAVASSIRGGVARAFTSWSWSRRRAATTSG